MSQHLFEFIPASRRPHRMAANTREMVFDDEPLEAILYGEKLPGPTPAGLYSRGVEFTRAFRAAHEAKRIDEMIAAAQGFTAEKVTLSLGCCSDIAAVMERHIPNYPCPVLEFDPSAFGPLLSEIWDLAIKAADPMLQDKAGTVLYRWFEHCGRYAEARGVLAKLIELQKALKRPVREAIYINNLAYEYLLEKRWQDAAPLFIEAAQVFKKIGQHFEHANSRCNYWACCFESDDLHQLEEAEAELQVHAVTLGSTGSWHSRKPFILLAKLKEKQGDIREAIKFVKQAIRSSPKSGARFIEWDGDYLNRLKSMVEK